VVGEKKQAYKGKKATKPDEPLLIDNKDFILEHLRHIRLFPHFKKIVIPIKV
jgi:hypothetical protein